MATQATLEQREAISSLSTLAERDLTSTFHQVDTSDLMAMQNTFGGTVLPMLGERYGSAASAIAVDWYTSERAASGVSGSYLALPAALPDAGRYDSLASWGIRRGFDAAGRSLGVYGAEAKQIAAYRTFAEWASDPLVRMVARDVALPLVVAALGAGTQRVIANAHRDTIVESADKDPKAEGWRRESGDAETCDFCRMLIGRGAVYTRKTSRFVAHDHCHCIAAPSWGGYGKEHSDLPQIARRVSDKRISDQTRKANNRRATEWINEHYH